MVARLLAALLLLAGGLVLGTAGPAAACSCVSQDPGRLARRAEVAFVGVLVDRRSGDGVVAHLFEVEDVRKGDVRQRQDVVTPGGGDASCGVDWATGTRMVVLGRVDGDGRLVSDLCSGSASEDDAAFDATVRALGAPRAPLPGRSVVDLRGTSGQGLLWSALAVGVVGALGMVVVRRLAGRGR